jgi:hypothetical protein
VKKKSSARAFALVKAGLEHVDEIDPRFTVSILMYLNVIWEDSRIQGPAQDDPTQMIPIDFGFVDSIWLPDIYIYDMKEILLSKFNIPFAGNTKI